MATSVEEPKTITINKKNIEMRPLKIRRLRQFMKAFDEIKEVADDNDKQIEVMIKCCVIAMDQYHKEFADQEFLEEELDINDVYLIIDAATGIKLGGDSGNELAAAQLGES